MELLKRSSKFGLDDIVLISPVTEDEIFETLRLRFQQDVVFTAIGSVLVSVNPYEQLPIFDSDFIRRYEGKFYHEESPHVFGLAEIAYRSLLNERSNVCMIVSGESGSGKTETCKYILKYLAEVTGSGGIADESVERVKKIIIESNPLLEAFGNARTVRNYNSSRFGKFMEVIFDDVGAPVGGRVSHFLLERFRVAHQEEGDRNFHIFYQLLAGADERLIDELQLYTPDKYWYLSQSNTYDLEGESGDMSYIGLGAVDEGVHFRRTLAAMTAIGLSSEEQGSILRVVAGILHIGNIFFVKGDDGPDGQPFAVIHDMEVIEIASELLGVAPELLVDVLTKRKLKIGAANEKEVTVGLNIEQSSAARDALASGLYSRLFDAIVAAVNKALTRNEAIDAEIGNSFGLLDIYGFEIFERNSFEQLCINFVNEKLQQLFIGITLRDEQAEYMAESIKWSMISYPDNRRICSVMDGKSPPGVFQVLDDVCLTAHAKSGAGGADLQLMIQLRTEFAQQEILSFHDRGFSVAHFAGVVKYEIDGMTDRNRDEFSSDILLALQDSADPWVRAMFVLDRAGRKRPSTASQKLRSETNRMLDKVEKGLPFFVRCIKPNDSKQPRVFLESLVRHQVRCLGLLELVRTKRAGYAFRAPFNHFVKRYEILVPSRRRGGQISRLARTIMDEGGLDPEHWKLGNSKVFMRFPECLFFLEDGRNRKLFSSAVTIQRAWRRQRFAGDYVRARSRGQALLVGNKERRRMSVVRGYAGDYIRASEDVSLKDIPVSCKGDCSRILFADFVNILHPGGLVKRKYKAAVRACVVTASHIYLVSRARVPSKKELVGQLKCTRAIEKSMISSISISPWADDFLVFHVPSEHDLLLEAQRKTELVALLETVRLSFSVRVSFIAKGSERSEVTWSRTNDVNASIVWKSGRSGVHIVVPPGLASDTNCDYHRPPPVSFDVMRESAAPFPQDTKKRAKGVGIGATGDRIGGGGVGMNMGSALARELDAQVKIGRTALRPAPHIPQGKVTRPHSPPPVVPSQVAALRSSPPPTSGTLESRTAAAHIRPQKRAPAPPPTVMEETIEQKLNKVSRSGDLEAHLKAGLTAEEQRERARAAVHAKPLPERPAAASARMRPSPVVPLPSKPAPRPEDVFGMDGDG